MYYSLHYESQIHFKQVLRLKTIKHTWKSTTLRIRQRRDSLLSCLNFLILNPYIKKKKKKCYRSINSSFPSR